MEFLGSLFEFDFLRNAVLACIAASIACGLMGPYVVVKRMGYLAGGISHAVFAGMGIAYFLQQSPFAGALLASIVAAFLMALIKLKWKQNEDVLITALWSGGMAIGILFIARTPGYNVDLMSYLFGNILLVSDTQLMLMLGLDVLLIVIVYWFYKPLLLVLFDEEFAEVRGISVSRIYTMLLCMIAISIVLMIQMVGLILVMALLVLPAATASLWSRSFNSLILSSIGLSILSSLGGLFISYEPDLPSGATMVLLILVIYLASLIGSHYLGQAR